MNKNLLTSGLLALAITLSASSIYTSALTIPTNEPPTHDPNLKTLIVGSGEDTAVISFDGQKVIFEGGAVIGETGNGIASSPNAMIGGGWGGQIITNGENSAIAGGWANQISSPNVSIGGGTQNQIFSSGEKSFIGGGQNNLIYSKFSNIAWGDYNTIHQNADYSTIVGGQNNSISASWSLAAGENVDIQTPNTFAWSDYVDINHAPQNGRYYGRLSTIGQTTTGFTTAKPDTFLVRALNGMAINTNSVPTGVNVNINGSVYITPDAVQDILRPGSCGDTTRGTVEVTNGCTYFCDGKYRQIMGLNFAGDDIATKCKIQDQTTCSYGPTQLRPGETVTAYTDAYAPFTRANACGGTAGCNQVEATCQPDGTFKVGSTTYPEVYPACLPPSVTYEFSLNANRYEASALGDNANIEVSSFMNGNSQGWTAQSNVSWITPKYIGACTDICRIPTPCRGATTCSFDPSMTPGGNFTNTQRPTPFAQLLTDIAANNGTTARTGKITFTQEGCNDTLEFTITQPAPRNCSAYSQKVTGTDTPQAAELNYYIEEGNLVVKGVVMEEIRIFDLRGKEILNKTVKGATGITIPVSQYPRGYACIVHVRYTKGWHKGFKVLVE